MSSLSRPFFCSAAKFIRSRLTILLSAYIIDLNNNLRVHRKTQFVICYLAYSFQQIAGNLAESQLSWRHVNAALIH
jgi:hypothetical protein